MKKHHWAYTVHHWPSNYQIMTFYCRIMIIIDSDQSTITDMMKFIQVIQVIQKFQFYGDHYFDNNRRLVRSWAEAVLGQHKVLDGVPEMRISDVVLLRFITKILLTLENCFADRENDDIQMQKWNRLYQNSLSTDLFQHCC